MNGLDLLLVYLQRARDSFFSRIDRRVGFHSLRRSESRIMLPVASRTPTRSRSAPACSSARARGSWSRREQTPARCCSSPTACACAGHPSRAVKSVVIEEAVGIASGVYISDHSHGFDQPGVPDPRPAAQRTAAGAHRPRGVAGAERGRAARRHDRRIRRDRRQLRRHAGHPAAHRRRRALLPASCGSW